jgi:hypothetical protein
MKATAGSNFSSKRKQNRRAHSKKERDPDESDITPTVRIILVNKRIATCNWQLSALHKNAYKLIFRWGFLWVEVEFA